MKNLTKVIAIAIAMFGFATSSFAQASTTASASAKIITPITIASTANLEFGNIALISGAAGTVEISADAAGTRTENGVQLNGVTGTVNAAKFEITGETGIFYTITMPSTLELVTNGGDTDTEKMAIALTGSRDLTGVAISATALENDFYIGGTLTVKASQAAGDYHTASNFEVSVNYN